jgi:hypothetical protein
MEHLASEYGTGERFPEELLSAEDFDRAFAIVGEWVSDEEGGHRALRAPDLIIAPNGNPYLYRWHLVRGPEANVYFHIQTAHDPERPLHDHPWPNQSVILAGGYNETLCQNPSAGEHAMTGDFIRRVGDTIWREAHWAHRLFLPEGTVYTMTLFSTGPKIRDWGFWYPEGWKIWTSVTTFVGNKSVHLPHADANQQS